MNRGPLLFLGILATLVTSFWGLVLAPDMGLGRQQQVTNAITGALYPTPRSGLAQRGADVYQSLGCVECHSQLVRGVGSDLARGWGSRMTVAQDYLGDYPVLLGNQRVGPDLANVGVRYNNAMELLRRLENPQLQVPGSMMPPYRFLFEKRKVLPGQKPAADALRVENGYQVVPTARADALAAYLLSLRTDSPLFEAPTPKGSVSANVSTNAASTNAAGGTNTPGPTGQTSKSPLSPNTATNAMVPNSSGSNNAPHLAPPRK